MSLSDMYYRAMIMIPIEVPKPDGGGSAPPELEKGVKTVLNLVAWAGTAAGVVGVLITGATMAIEHRKGNGSEHMSRLGVVLAGCILVATAGPVVSWFFGENGVGGGGDGGTGDGGTGNGGQ